MSSSPHPTHVGDVEAAHESGDTRIYNITSAWAVDREFFDIYLSLWLPLASFGCLWSAFGVPWADFGLLLTLLGTLGLPLGVLWAPAVPFGVPLGSLWPAFGVPLAVLGHMEPG